MPISVERVTVTNQATLLADQSQAFAPMDVLVTNAGTIPVDIGDENVVSGQGYQLAPGKSISMTLNQEDHVVYAITASSTCRVDVIRL